MSHISKHDTKEEGERNTSEDSGVNFLVHGDTIGVDNLLESPSEVIVFYVSGWLDCVVTESLKVCGGVCLQCLSNLLFVGNWTPEESNVSTSTLSHVIEGMIKCFFLCNEPFVDFKS